MVTLASMEELEQGPRAPVEIEVPASTAWPIVLALGFTLLFAGLLTSVSVSALGVVLSLAGCVGSRRSGNLRRKRDPNSRGRREG